MTGGDAPTTPGTEQPARSKFSDLLFLNQSNPTPAPPRDPAKQPISCPNVRVTNGQSAFILYERGQEGSPLAVRYQASFGKLARECVDLGAEAGLRIGVSGRLAMGPMGKAGTTIEVPIRFVVKDNEDNVVLTRTTRLPVTVPPDQAGASFTYVEELGSVPMPEGRLRNWQFEVGFDNNTRPGGRPQG